MAPMDYMEANKLVNEQHPVRRSTWPEGHHVRHYVENSISKLKRHTPGQDEAAEYLPDAEDQAAQDWEQYIPKQQVREDQQEQDERPATEAKHKKK